MSKSYKTWRPSKQLLSHLTKQEIDTIEYENANWPTGLEGGQYDSNEGVRSSSFAVAWALLSIVAIGMPVNPDEKRKEHLHSFLLSLGHVLPCKACRTSFDANIVASGYNPVVHLQSRQAFARYIHKLHNTVNVMLGKPLYDYDEYRRTYEVLRARCTKNRPGQKGSCDGALHKNDKKASCMISILTEVQANKEMKRNGGSRIHISEECKLKPNTVAVRRKKSKKCKSSTTRSSRKR